MGVDWDAAFKRDLDLVIALARKRKNTRVHEQAGEVVHLKSLNSSGADHTALMLVKAWPRAYRTLVSLQTRMYLGERMV